MEPTLFDNKKPKFKLELTPVEKHEGIFFKREDLYTIADVFGSKARAIWNIYQKAKGLVAACARNAPTANIIAHIAHKLNIPCVLHTYTGELLSEIQDAITVGAKVYQHKNARPSHLEKFAREDSFKLGYKQIPFGVGCKECIEITSEQVKNLPKEVKRIVIVTASGVSLSAVLTGLFKYKLKIPVLGVGSGADPVRALSQFAPNNWKNMVKIVSSELAYANKPKETSFGGIQLDPYYEAKCLPYLEKGDLFWIVGIRRTGF